MTDLFIALSLAGRVLEQGLSWHLIKWKVFENVSYQYIFKRNSLLYFDILKLLTQTKGFDIIFVCVCAYSFHTRTLRSLWTYNTWALRIVLGWKTSYICYVSIPRKALGKQHGFPNWSRAHGLTSQTHNTQADVATKDLVIHKLKMKKTTTEK